MKKINEDRLLKHKYKRDQIRTTKITVVSAFHLNDYAEGGYRAAALTW